METDDKLKYYVIVTPFFPSEKSFRGPFIYDMAKAIKQSHRYKDVIIFKPKKINEKNSYYIYKDFKVNLFSVINLPSYFFNGCCNFINKFFFLRILEKLNIKIKDIGVIHGHTSTFGIYCNILKTRNKNILTILQHHDPDPYTIRNGILSEWGPNLLFRAKYNINLFSQIDWHICVSNYVKENLLLFPESSKEEIYSSYLCKLNKLSKYKLNKPIFKHLYVLYNGVDLNIFKNLTNNTKYGFTIGCIGNFVDWKGQIVLLKALKILVREYKYNNIKINFIGSGPELINCINYVNINKLNNYVSFIKEVEHSELNNFYNKIDLFCLPSYFEGFGCVFTEAAACGKPYICVKHQGASEYIADEEKDKWTINPNDYNTLAKLIDNYFKTRPIQHYKYSFDINYLVTNYLNTIAK